MTGLVDNRITANTTQDIWKDHPEKVLGTTSDFIRKYPNTARAVMMAVMEAGRIVEQGAHEALLQRRGAYYDLYMTQFRGGAEEGQGEKAGATRAGGAESAP